MDIGSVDELLMTTRAVRRRLDLERPVEPELLLECLRLALQAPTGGNRQGWRFVVVTDPLKRRRLAEIYASVDAERADPSVPGRSMLEQQRDKAAAAGDEQTARVYGSAVYLRDVLDRVPVHLIPCIEGELGTTAAEVAGPLASIIPAVWSFMLAARSRGLGTVWTTLHLTRAAEVADLLGIPDGIIQVALIPVAHTLGSTFKPAARRPVEEVTFWDTWGAGLTGD